ncbi:unnamed protein product [Schistocephalus solidus]|uniref:CTP_synth_N domain-containing protein n=1 Tax=Schistocephalus solidus TaxID=70667 RepID=A0A183SG43_SCHSO|nr:unnamed protein product [Schistocephalus solidus]
MTLYRPLRTDNDADTRLLETKKEIGSQPDVVLIGDFLVPRIRWNDLQAQCSKYSFDHRLLTTKREALLTQHVFDPKRVREGKQASCLDLVFIKDPESIDEVYQLHPLIKNLEFIFG